MLLATSAMGQVSCTIAADNLWSEDMDAELFGKKLTVEEGACWEFDLGPVDIYS